MIMNGYTLGYDRASLLDIAITSTGELETIINLCEENGISVTDEVKIDDVFTVNNNNGVLDTAICRRVQAENLRPATALSPGDLATCPFGGIGFMGIEIDFKVY